MSRKPKKPARKHIAITLDITVPAWMTARDARREVRTLINHQSNYMDGRWLITPEGRHWEEVHEKTVRAHRVAPVKSPK